MPSEPSVELTYMYHTLTPEIFKGEFEIRKRRDIDKLYGLVYIFSSSHYMTFI